MYGRYFFFSLNACNLSMNFIDEKIVWHELQLSLDEDT